MKPPSSRASPKVVISLLGDSQNPDDDDDGYGVKPPASSGSRSSRRPEDAVQVVLDLVEDSQEEIGDGDGDGDDNDEYARPSMSEQRTPFLPVGPAAAASSASSSSSSSSLALARRHVFARAGDSVYDERAVPSAGAVSLNLVVDTRERKANSTYQSLAKSIEAQLARHVRVSDAGAVVASIRIGDFLWALEDDLDALQQWTAGVIVERKTLNDIMGSSAQRTSKGKGDEARHFKQERQLRYCGAPHAFMLIEARPPPVPLRKPPKRSLPRPFSRPPPGSSIAGRCGDEPVRVGPQQAACRQQGRPRQRPRRRHLVQGGARHLHRGRVGAQRGQVPRQGAPHLAPVRPSCPTPD